MNRAEVSRQIEELGIVPVVRTSNADLAMRAVDALIAGSVPVVEVTMTVPDACSVINAVSTDFGNTVLIGAGTVTSPDQARAAVDAGAQFIVSPGFDLKTVEAAKALKVLVVPGALTPSEIMAATTAGVDMVKIFPCSALGGAKYLRALRAPFPQIKMMPTGGVNLKTAAEYVRAGAAALGVGSDLVDPKLLKAGQHKTVSERAQAFVAIVRETRLEI